MVTKICGMDGESGVMRHEIFIIVWKEHTSKDELEIIEIRRFFDAIRAWQYVIDNNIKKYTVHSASCVIDQS